MMFRYAAVLALGVMPLVHAGSLDVQLENYRQQAKAAQPGFSGFSASRGQAFYLKKNQKNGKTISCASCHTSDPKREGLTPAYRKIGPMAPAVNPQRFTDSRKVEKWFRRNCDDVLSRECTPLEKGDFLTFMASIR